MKEVTDTLKELGADRRDLGKSLMVSLCVECDRPGTKGRSRRMTMCQTCSAAVCKACWYTHWTKRHEP